VTANAFSECLGIFLFHFNLILYSFMFIQIKWRNVVLWMVIPCAKITSFNLYVNMCSTIRNPDRDRNIIHDKQWPKKKWHGLLAIRRN
jgi:hypothetical protein